MKQGTKLKFISGPEPILGVVSSPEVLPEGKIWILQDIIIQWETGQASTYDQEWIDTHCVEVP